MIRSYVLAAALAAGLAVPALAADNVANAGNAFTQENARQHLLHLGYTNVSQLQKDAHGNWAGTAVKDGKTVPVAVGVKGGPTGTN
jgi:putative membrane protein